MKRSAIGLVVMCALVALGCPGQKPPQAPAPKGPDAASEGPLVWHLSKSGLGFRLSNADEDADQESKRKVAPSTPLGESDAKKIVARLPALLSEPDDAKDFAMRDKSIPAPRPGKTVSEAFPPPGGPPPASVVPAGPLTVERRAPEGPVDLAPHLTMTFSQPMVPITSMDDLAKEKLPVSLVPQPAGKWRWLGTKTLMFQPDKRFPMATEYAVDIPSGTKAMNGQTLAKATQWTFTTPPVTLKRSWPSSSQEPLEPLIFAELDQQIETKALLGSVELVSAKGPVPIRLAEADEIEANDTVRRLSQQAEKGRWIALRPVGKLPVASSFTVRLKAGAPSAEGPRRTTKEQAFGFSTYGPLRVEQSYCAYGKACPPLTPFSVIFTNSIDNKTFDKKLVSVVPELPGLKIEVHGRSMTISGRTKGRTKYDVTIDGAIGDIHEQKMGTAAKLSFDVGSAEPQMFGAENDMVVLDPASAKSYTVYSINEPGLHARVFSVGPEDWSKYVAYLQEWERPRKLKPPGRLVADKVLTPKKAPDELVATPIELGPALNGGYGQTVVVVEPTRAPPKGYHRAELDIWVQSTDLGVNAYVEDDQLTGWVTRLADGAPESGVQVSLLEAGSATTDKEGLARVPFGNKPGQLVFAKKGKDLAIVPERYMGGNAYALLRRSDTARWFVYDDRGMYKPGEEVHVKGWLRRAVATRGGDLDAVPDIKGKNITWKIRDPRYAEIGAGTTTADELGGFDFAFKLPGNANLGQAHVELQVEGVSVSGYTHQHSFEVQEFRRPEFEVTAKSSEGPHFVGRHAVATLNAAYYSGGGLPDAPVEWHVTRSTVGFTPPNRSEYHFGPEPSFHWSWRSKASETRTETWTSHTNPQGVHRLRVDFDAIEPSYPMSLAFTAQVEDVNRQQWAGRTTMLVHPADQTVGMRLAKSFIRAGENIDLDLVVSDIEGKLVGGRPVTVKAARIDWEQQGSEYVEKELDPQTCETKSVAASADDKVRCTFKAAQGGSWRVTAIVQDEHGRKSQSATQIYVMGGDVPKDRKLGAERVTIVPDKKEYQPGDLAEVLVLAPFVPAEGLLTIRRQGVVHVERITMKTAAQAIKVKLDDALVPNAELRVDLVGASARDDAAGQPDPSLPKRPAYAAGTMGLKILPTNRTLAVTAAAKATAVEPGASTQIEVDVKGPDGRAVSGAQVAVVVVDEAVLALSGYKTPDPVAVFYAPRSTDVREIAVRDRILLTDPDLARLRAVNARAEISNGIGFGRGAGRAAPTKSAPGGAYPVAPPSPSAEAAPAQARKVASGEDKQGKKERGGLDDWKSAEDGDAPSVVGQNKAPIQLRSNFAALALFAPHVKTDGKGHASVPLKLPDNLTRYRVMAMVASGDRSFGSNESTLTARLPVMARLSAPRFLNFGDTFELPVIVQNQTDAPVEVGIVARATNATVAEPSSKRVKIAPNDRVEVRFAAGTVKPGTARFQIGIASGGFSDASQVELPVYTPATTEAFATYGEIDEGAIAQPVKMPPGVFTQFGGLEITTSSTQVQALTEAVLYLVKYPFECNEQIASRVMSIAALRDVLSAFKAEGLPKPAALEASMVTDFEKLKRHQNGNGGWGFWQETPWPYLSIHVAHALVRAKDKGYKPDEEMLRRAQSYLRNVESYIPSWYSEDARRSLIAYALFVRKKLNDADPGRAKRLIVEAGGVDKLPIEAVGWIWPTISQDKNSAAENEAIRRHVANRVTETAGNAHFVSGYKDADWLLLNSDRRADGILLESMIGDQKDGTIIPKLVKGLLAHRTAGRWQNTNENAFVLLALDRYFNTYEKVTPDFVARVWLGDRFAGQHAFKGRTTEFSEVKIPMQWLAGELKGQQQNLVVGKDGPGRLYYRVGMQYAPTDLKLPPADHGFVVSRIYEGAEKPEDVKRDPDGTWRVKAGSKVRVRVSMVAQSRRYHVALVDPIPAGLEALNPALAVTGEIPKDPKNEATQAKGGRYWYWNRTWYEHQNMRDERVEAFASLLYDGVWDYSYVAKATTPGVYVVPPPKAEEMYSPETFGRGAGDRMIVE
ncbi:MAG TPA: alpha-2-macroglobulin family protein [Labilithrix sp.]|nr:alpha-2-macroglobulin family protein [Labilithrix sp.]